MMSSDLPPALEHLARDYQLRPVAHGRSGARVFRLESLSREVLFLKVVSPPAAAALRGEAVRLDWLHGKAPVPKVVEFHEGVDGAHLLTEALPGTALIAFNDSEDACKRRMAALLGEGLAALHAVDVSDCPFRSAPQSRQDPAGPSPTSPSDVEQALALRDLRSRMPEPAGEVLTHGDPCLPNVLVIEGTLSGFVDLGGAGVGDPRDDLALALWSLEYNYGAGWNETLLEAYRAAG